MNTFGERFRLSIFGESHGAAVGVVLDGLPPGFAPDMEAVREQMRRRRPGQGEHTTARQEADEPEILSGLFEGKTTGAPLCCILRNADTRSGDYAPHLPRPGHADLASFAKYKGFADYRGGGHFSGRLTAPLVFAGALARQLLPGVSVTAGIREIGGHPAGDGCRTDVILAAKQDGDSVGGVIACKVEGLPAGLGEPFFGSVESRLAALLFSIPAVKAAEFDDGIRLAGLRGSESNRYPFGVLGGITSGKTLSFSVWVKPTPSVALEQDTVDLRTGLPAKLTVKGRHDPCIVPRAVPVVEAVAAVGLLDLWLIAGFPL
ncbi:MAG: chorismate synthase [Oscillospiraceae bacterium]|jgi:chorismate synthase|nr:chorismate synthase [Oscillospiraceae bacterium]